jgi:hypothetical protein
MPGDIERRRKTRRLHPSARQSRFAGPCRDARSRSTPLQLIGSRGQRRAGGIEETFDVLDAEADAAAGHELHGFEHASAAQPVDGGRRAAQHLGQLLLAHECAPLRVDRHGSREYDALLVIDSARRISHESRTAGLGCDHRHVELTGWETVVISLGGGGVTGAAAVAVAVVTGKQGRKQLERRIEHESDQQTERLRYDREEHESKLRHERSEAWTDRLVRAADDFAIGIEQAILGVRDVIAFVGEDREPEPVVEEAKRRLHEAVARMARVRLLFRDDAEVVQPAKDLLHELDLARGAATNRDPTFAWEKLERVYALRDEFNAAAIKAIADAQQH